MGRRRGISEETKTLMRKYNATYDGKYWLYRKGMSRNYWFPTRYRFNTIEDAVNFAVESEEVNEFRVGHYDVLGENWVNFVLDYDGSVKNE